MDESQEYILMCKQAKEIQELRKMDGHTVRPMRSWIDGDMIALKYDVFMYNGCDHSEGFIEPDVYDEDCVFLPRQDQLQEMIINRVHGSASELINWVFSWQETLFQKSPYESMEQFWLMFVMGDKYNKVWKDGDWGVNDG